MTTFETLRRASEDIKLRTNEFNNRLEALRDLEHGVTHYNTKFENITAVYDGDYKLAIADIGEFPLAPKAIEGIMGKSGVNFETTKTTFDNIRDVPNLSAENPIGFDYLYQTLERSKRDNKFSIEQHRLLFHNNVIRALVNHDFPYNAFNISDFTDSFMDVADFRGKTIENPMLSFNEDSGNVNVELNFDKIDLPNASVNDAVGFGLKISDARFGGRNFQLSTNMRVLACSNGIIGNQAIDELIIRHSSFANFARHISKFLNNNVGGRFDPLFNGGQNNSKLKAEYAIVKWMETREKMPDMDYMDTFYNLLAETVFDVVDKQKETQKVVLETATTTNLADFEKSLNKVFTEFRLPRRDMKIAQEVWNNDDLINSSKSSSLYDFSNVFSRMANDPNFNDEKREQYQKVAYEVLIPK